MCLCFAELGLADDRALIIGINKYPHLTRNDQPVDKNLHAAVMDARRMANFVETDLKYPASSIKLLIDNEATKNGILSAFEHWIIKGTEAGDRVFIYYSGHGATVRDVDGDEALRDPDDQIDEVLAPHDISAD